MNRDEQDAQRTERSLSGREIMRSLQAGCSGWGQFDSWTLPKDPGKRFDKLMSRATNDRSITKSDLDTLVQTNLAAYDNGKGMNWGVIPRDYKGTVTPEYVKSQLVNNLKQSKVTIGETHMNDSSGWNPFKAVRHLAEDVVHVATKVVTVPFMTVSQIYNKVTPSDLKKILRWTPYGLAIRAGVKIAPATKKALGQVVKWSPTGMVYRGMEHELPQVSSKLSGESESGRYGVTIEQLGHMDPVTRAKVQDLITAGRIKLD